MSTRTDFTPGAVLVLRCQSNFVLHKDWPGMTQAMTDYNRALREDDVVGKDMAMSRTRRINKTREFASGARLRFLGAAGEGMQEHLILETLEQPSEIVHLGTILNLQVEEE